MLTPIQRTLYSDWRQGLLTGINPTYASDLELVLPRLLKTILMLDMEIQTLREEAKR